MMDDHDLVADVDQNKIYTSGMDALEDNRIKVTSGLFKIQELLFGTILALATCITGLVFKKSKLTNP